MRTKKSKTGTPESPSYLQAPDVPGYLKFPLVIQKECKGVGGSDGEIIQYLASDAADKTVLKQYWNIPPVDRRSYRFSKNIEVSAITFPDSPKFTNAGEFMMYMCTSRNYRIVQ